MVIGGLGVDGTHISLVTHCQTLTIEPPPLPHLMFVCLVSLCVEPADATQAATIHNFTVSDPQK